MFLRQWPAVLSLPMRANRSLFLNPAAESILGKRRVELIGQHLSSCLPEISGRLEHYLEQVQLADRKILGLEVQTVNHGNHSKTLSLNIAPLKDREQNTHGLAIVLDDLTEKKRLEAQRRLFGRMVSPGVIEQIDPNKLQLGGKRQEITTLFTDLRGFTHFSELLEPEKLVSILNLYLAAAAQLCYSRTGRNYR